MISQQPAINRFAILERALPTLEQISEAQFQELVRDMDELIAADGRISHWEFLVRQVVLHHFEHNLGYTSPHDLKAPKEKVMSVQAAFGILLRTLCRVAGRDERNAWGVATKVLSNSAIVQFPEDPFPPHWTVLQQSLKRAEHANKRTKVELMNACTAAVQAEGTISLPALDMLRLLSIVMETPIPLSQA